MTREQVSSRRGPRTARFYFNGPMQVGCDLQLDKKASHHLLTVLRAKPGSQLLVFNGDGNNYHATLAQNEQRRKVKQALLHIEACEPANNESPLHITLVQCISRSERMDISIRQCIELGVNAIQPIISRHSVKSGDPTRSLKKQQHWSNLMISSSEQCGRAVLPALYEALTLQQWLQTQKSVLPAQMSGEKHYVLAPDANTSLSQHAHTLAAASQQEIPRISLIIGPESGLDADEIDAAVHNGAEPASLGGRILRTETAGPTCITLLQTILGDLKPSTAESNSSSNLS